MKNKFIILLTFFIIVCSIIGATLYKVYNLHQQRVVKVSEKRIEEAFENCLNESNCQGNKITLAELQNKGYIGNEINPLTKTYYNLASYVTVVNNEYYFTEVK